jgi:hypothetical protein
MKIADSVLILLFGILLLVFIAPVNHVFAEPEEEDEEPVQTMPNPVTKASKVKPADSLSNVKDDGEHGDGKFSTKGVAVDSGPGPGGRVNGAAVSYDGVDGESNGKSVRLKRVRNMGKKVQ